MTQLTPERPTPSITIGRSPQPDRVHYTRESMKEVVVAVAHLLAHFSDKSHPGLNEPQNRTRVVPGTGVIVHGRFNGREHMVGFQFFATHAEHNDTLAVAFDMTGYETYGDKYLFNMLKKVAQTLRETHRPSESRLRELSTQFMLKN